MNENDLRVIKTRENIYKTFEKLLKEKHFSKISIKELCERARISKGTFYYHFEDIFHLYRSYLEDVIIDDYINYLKPFDSVTIDPVPFFNRVHNHKIEKESSLKLILKDRTMSMYKDIIINRMIEAYYLEKNTEKNPLYDAKLYTLFNTMLDTASWVNDDSITNEILKSIAESLFH